MNARLMTWVVSASVVVLVSAISFSAGYAMGKEVKGLEMSEAVGGRVGDLGERIVGGSGRSLRRLRGMSGVSGRWGVVSA